MQDFSRTALVIIDNQMGAVLPTGFFGPVRSNPNYFDNIRILLAAFRRFRITQAPVLPPHIIHVYHNSRNPDSPLVAGKRTADEHPTSAPMAGEPIFWKRTSSAFEVPELREFVIQNNIARMYFTEVSLDHSVGSSIRHARDLQILDPVEHNGYIPGDVVLVEDAVAAWAKDVGSPSHGPEIVYAVHVDSLKAQFARVIDTRNAMAELGVQAPGPALIHAPAQDHLLA
jgi:nicotinamidase-related amidase